jgi:tRNA U34 2-thiouridine synthase MnmA/TrmU
MNWLALHDKHKYEAQIRYRQKPQMCTISEIDSDTFSVEFDAPQRAITP